MRIGYLKIEIRPWVSDDDRTKELCVTIECDGTEHHYTTRVNESDLISNFEVYLEIAKREILKLIKPRYVPDVEGWEPQEGDDKEE